MTPTATMEITLGIPLSEIGLYGQTVLEQAAQKYPCPGRLLIGILCGEPFRTLAREGTLPCPEVPEAFSFARLPDGSYVLAGYDETGLMYGCQELAEKLEAGAALADIPPFSGKPFNKTRGLYAFLHNQDLEEEWFYSPAYWTGYFDEMAASRYNSFNLVFSHQTSYLVPMFAYFLDMPDFPDIYPTNMDKGQIRRNRDMLRFIGDQAQKRGIDFLLGIWQVSPWKNEQAIKVHGLTPENLRAYTYAGMKRLIEEFPGVKGLQIRANWESGIQTAEQTEFFTNTLFKAMAESPRPFVFDFRCWLAEPQTVENALKMVPGTRLSCKYWAEFLGAPYQPAKIMPGYSYSDFLRQPMKTDFIYQVWSLGSPRLLLWGDPAYARRFARSLKLGGGTGFEINLPLVQKGYGNESGAWRIFKRPEDEYFAYEYQRYWLFHRLFGRVSYDPDCGEAAWMLPMRRRFGEDAQAVMNVYQAGSGIITFLIQYMLGDPNMYIWPEIDTGGVLELYMQTPSSDACVMEGIEPYVESLLKGEFSGKMSPLCAADDLYRMAQNTLAAMMGLQGREDASKELRSTLTDFSALSFLALYHSEKTRAAVTLKLYFATRDIAHLRTCYDHIRRATAQWERLIAVTQDVYHDKMVTGPNDAGCWKTKRTLVYEDELHVARLLEEAGDTAAMRLGFDFGPLAQAPVCRTFYKLPITTDYPLSKGYQLADSRTAYTKEQGYGWEQGEPRDAAMAPVRLYDLQFDPWSRDNWRYTDVESLKGFGSALYEDGVLGASPAVFRCDLPAGEYEVNVLIQDLTSQSRVHGSMSVAMGGKRFDQLTILPGEKKVLTARVKTAGEPLRVCLDCAPGAQWFISAITVRDLAPVIRTAPVARFLPGDKILLTASVFSPEGVAKAEVLLGAARAALPMERTGENEYRADLTAALAGCGEVRVPCVLRAESGMGKVTQAEVLMILQKVPGRISVSHTPVSLGRAGEDIRIEARVESVYPLAAARLHYSQVNQFEPMQQADMILADGVYRARIPGGYVKVEWDLLYYLEFVDEAGNGVLYPDMRECTPYFVIQPER